MRRQAWGSDALRRVDQVGRVVRHDGLRGLATRVLRAVEKRVDVPSNALPLRAEEIVRAVPAVRSEGSAASASTGPLLVNWIMTPPPPGSGGHTTLLRLVSHLERAGHVCRLYLYDRYSGNIFDHEETLRQHWPHIGAEVADPLAGMKPADAVVATSWQTAYIAAAPGAPGRRFYLVQDFEPLFYPAGAESLLAENTYRFGFHGITAGAWLAEKLTAEYDMPCDHFEFGADTDVYRLATATGTAAGAGPATPRDGVVFYAKPSTPRRAYTLGLLALAEFARRHPQTPIHLFGEDIGALPFDVVRHGVITPAELNALYNRCIAGLCLSVTNLSLIPFELLASGCIPVINDARHNRMLLDNPHVRYVRPTPSDLAAALSDLVTGADGLTTASRAAAAASSVADLPWDAAGATVERVLLRELRGATPAASAAVTQSASA